MKAVTSLFRKPREVDETALRLKVSAGQKAAAALASEEISGAIEEVREFYTSTMVESQDPETRDSCWFALAALRDIQASLRRKADDGTAAAKQLSKLTEER